MHQTNDIALNVTHLLFTITVIIFTTCEAESQPTQLGAHVAPADNDESLDIEQSLLSTRSRSGTRLRPPPPLTQLRTGNLIITYAPPDYARSVPVVYRGDFDSDLGRF